MKTVYSELVGKKFKAYGCIYKCIKYDPILGLYMELIEGEDTVFKRHIGYVICISERTIGSSYHEIKE